MSYQVYIYVMSDNVLTSIKYYREQAGLTQKEVELQLGLRNLMLRDYETGRLKLPVSVALKMARLYKVSINSLVGEKEDSDSKFLFNFNSLFIGNNFSMMFLDPVIKAAMENHSENFFHQSLFDILTMQLNDNDKKRLIIELCKFLFSLASVDGKISKNEIKTLRTLFKEFELEKHYKEISVLTSSPYVPDALPEVLLRIEIRHFVIWVLFFFGFADKKICIEEIKYIEKCAEKLKINRTNFLFIKEMFVQEND